MFYSSICFRISYITKVLLDMAAIVATILDDAREHEDEGQPCEGPERDEVAELGLAVLCEGGNAGIGNKGSQLLGVPEDWESLVEDFIEEGVGDDEGWIWAACLGLH